ncbi:MAG: PQ-loop domain-containing transporter [Minisyncoccota bacterium]
MTLVEIIGFIGSGLVIWAYVPQITHLIREHCSAGISRRAYALWFIAALLLLIHAVMIRDIVFIFLQTANALLTLVILVFAYKYKNGICPTHASGKSPF